MVEVEEIHYVQSMALLVLLLSMTHAVHDRLRGHDGDQIFRPVEAGPGLDRPCNLPGLHQVHIGQGLAQYRTTVPQRTNVVGVLAGPIVWPGPEGHRCGFTKNAQP